MNCQCIRNGAIEIVGLCDPDKIIISPDAGEHSWTQLSIPEILTIPPQKPSIESIDKVFIDVQIISRRVVKIPAPSDPELPNEEGTLLTGWKLVIEGLLCQKIVYTGNVAQQTVHSAHFKIPFSAFIMLPVDTLPTDKFCVVPCVEDVFIKAINSRQVFKNVTLFLKAEKLPFCD